MKKNLFLIFLFLLCNLFLRAQLPSGAVAEYPFNNNTANDISGNGNTGSLNSTSAATNRFGITNAALQFSGSSTYGTVPVVVEDNFTVGYWINTTMSSANGSQWYNGTSLVNAEVGGVTNDWGTSLINVGKIAFGIGNPDMTIISPSNYNDGQWHFVTITRDESGSGTIILYVDGASVASATGVATSSRNAPSFIGLGRDASILSNYTGELDDLIFYNRVLTSTEVTALYSQSSAYTLPINWISFTGEITGSTTNLKWEVGKSGLLDHFEIEHSTDALHFSTLAKLSATNNISESQGNVEYAFQDGSPQKGINYYRIKEVDLNGENSLSSTIHLTFQNLLSGLNLLSNPVQDKVVLNNPSQLMINEIVVMDLLGRVMSRQSISSTNNKITIDVSHYLSGYYLLHAITNKNETTFSFVKR